MKIDSTLPSFEGVTEWINRRTTGGHDSKFKDTLARTTKNRITLIHFWSLNSEASTINLGQVAELRDKRRRDGLHVIAVHVPGFETDKDSKTVSDAATRFNLTEPCAL